ncbi:MAG: LysR family transcriptional regulator [Clostridium sp.]|uniref:LysR family transcriptional regulator n=1 Tax=Clostridium sp. TaxID=1506 RepID=UPI003EE7990D
MNIESLKYFHDIVELKSISKVAKNSHISQPALSHQLFKLENEFNNKLLERSNKGVEITEKGQIVYEYSKKILEIYKELEYELNKNEMTKKELKVTNTNIYANYIFSSIAGGIGSIFDTFNVQMNKDIKSRGEALLINKKSDIIIGNYKIEYEDIKCEYIGKDKLVLVSKKEIENFENIRVGILDDVHSTKVEDRVREKGLNLVLKSNSTGIINGFLEGKQTCAIISSSEAKEKRDLYIYEINDCYYDIYISYRKDINLEMKNRIRGLKEKIINIIK